MDCPFCHKEGHLYYNPSKRVFYCFKCGAKGTGQVLERAGHNLVTRDVLQRDVSYRIVEGLEDPPPYEHLSDATRLYLLERGIHAPVLAALERKIYDTAKGILFFFPDEEYWQVRHWQPHTPPRWKNPSVAPRGSGGGVTYHIRQHYDSSRVCLVEGIGDALRVAPYANVAALLSSNPHESQLLSLLERGYDRVTFLFDRDVSTTKRIESLSRAGAIFNGASTFCYGEDGDPGSARDEELARLQHV